MDNPRIANFEISDEIPNFDNSEADADALVQYAMRKRREHRGGGPLFQPKRNDEPKAGFHVKVIGKPTTTSIVNDAGIPQSKIMPLRFTEPKQNASLGRRVLRSEFEKSNPRNVISDEDLTVNITRFDNPQACSTPVARPTGIVAVANVAMATINPLKEQIATSTSKSVQIPGVEININLNHSKQVSPDTEMSNDALPVLPEGLTTPQRRSVTHLPPSQSSSRPSTRPPTPFIKDKFLTELDSQCNAAKTVKEAHSSVVASPAVVSAHLCSPTHRVQRSLQFGSPKPTVQQPQVLAPSGATITLKVVVDNPTKSPSVPAEKVYEPTEGITVGIEKHQQTDNAAKSIDSNQSALCSKRVSSIELPIFKTPHIPKKRTTLQNNVQQPLPLADISQILLNEPDVDVFWLNFDHQMRASPRESKISRACTTLPLYINPHKIAASQTFNSQQSRRKATLNDIEKLERSIHDSVRNSNKSTRRVLYRKRDPSPEQSKRCEATSITTDEISKQISNNEVIGIPLNGHQLIGKGQSLLEKHNDSRNLYPKIVLNRIDDARGLQSICRISGENLKNTKSMTTTKKSSKRNARDVSDSEDASVQLESSWKRQTKNSEIAGVQSMPLKGDINIKRNLQKKQNVIVDNYDKNGCIADDIHAEGQSSVRYSPQSHLQPYMEKTLIMHIPLSTRIKTRSTLACPSETGDLNGSLRESLTESQSEEEHTRCDSSSSHSKVPEDATKITMDDSNSQYNESDFESPEEDGSTLDDNPQREISVRGNSNFNDDEDSQYPTHSRLQRTEKSQDNWSKSLDSPEDFQSFDDDEDLQEQESSQEQSSFQSSVQDESRQTSLQNESPQTSVQDDSSPSTLQDDRLQASVQGDSRKSYVQDDNSQSTLQNDSRQSSVLVDSRKQTNLSELNDSSDASCSDEDENSRRNLSRFSKQMSIRASIQAAENVKQSSILQESSKRSDNSASPSPSTQSVQSSTAASKNGKVTKRSKKRKIKFVEEVYYPSKRRQLDTDEPGLRRSKRENKIPHKYWTSKVEPISPIVLASKVKSSAKKPIIRKQINNDFAQAHLDVFNSEFAFLEQDRSAFSDEHIVDLDDGVIVRHAGITYSEKNGNQYWHYAAQADKICGYIRIPAMSRKKKTETTKQLDILVLKGKVIVNIGEKKNVAEAGDQIRINEGISYDFQNTEQAAALLYYTKFF